MLSLLTEIYRFQGFQQSQHDEYEDGGDGDSVGRGGRMSGRVRVGRSAPGWVGDSKGGRETGLTTFQ